MTMIPSPIFNAKYLRSYHGENLRVSLFSQLWGIDEGASIKNIENLFLISTQKVLF